MNDSPAGDAGSLDQWLDTCAVNRQAHHLERHRRVLNGNRSGRNTGRSCIRCSTSAATITWGWRHIPNSCAALKDAADDHGVGSGASALVTGFREQHRLLEQELAEFLQREKVLLCSSGYLANLAVATSLAGKGDVIIQDKLCHASLIDAARLSGARLCRYGHVDMAALKRRLSTAGEDKKLVVSDGIFSMDGDTAPLKEMAALCREHRAWLVIDDAHGIGVCGPGGRGSVAAAGLNGQQVPILSGHPG